LTSIGDRAFYGCTNLESIYFQAGAGSLGATVFGHDPALAEIYFAGSQPSVTNSGADLFAASGSATIYALNSSSWSSSLGGMTVAQWQPVLSTPVKSSGSLTFNVGWANGQSVRVQTSTNLAEGVWDNWKTNVISGGTCAFTDTNTALNQRFYRVVSGN
jgi:hypothetical protein